MSLRDSFQILSQFIGMIKTTSNIIKFLLNIFCTCIKRCSWFILIIIKRSSWLILTNGSETLINFRLIIAIIWIFIRIAILYVTEWLFSGDGSNISERKIVLFIVFSLKIMFFLLIEMFLKLWHCLICLSIFWRFGYKFWINKR